MCELATMLLEKSVVFGYTALQHNVLMAESYAMPFLSHVLNYDTLWKHLKQVVQVQETNQHPRVQAVLKSFQPNMTDKQV